MAALRVGEVPKDMASTECSVIFYMRRNTREGGKTMSSEGGRYVRRHRGLPAPGLAVPF